VTLHLANITFDCGDALAVARFWSAALDRPLDSEPEPGEHFASIGLGDTSGTSWLFAQVPESKTAKNRVHVDLHTEDRDAVAREVERLVALGATVIRPPKEEFGTYWATLQDPEGNEFCVGTS
jgi:predicted enzyme related to lactoylglutathione lyase